MWETMTFYFYYSVSHLNIECVQDLFNFSVLLFRYLKKYIYLYINKFILFLTLYIL